MKSTISWAALLSSLLLTACSGGGDSSSPTSNASLTTKPSAGFASSFSVNGDPAGNFGESFVGPDGNGFIVVSPTDDQPAQSLYRISNETTQRVPGGLSSPVSFDATSTAPVQTTPITLAQIVGTYTILIDGVQTDFQIANDGTVSTPTSSCKLYGALGVATGIVGTVPFAFSMSGCTKSGAFNGYLISATDYKPSSFRLVAENGTSIIDAFAYKYVTP